MTNIINISKKVDSTSELKSPRWIYQRHVNGELHYDRERLQRLLKQWSKNKVNSYLTTLFNGASLKDTIQLANIKTIVEQLEKDLIDTNDAFEREYLQDNFDYFKHLENQGKVYLVLDGQHRIEEIVKYFNNITIFNPVQSVVFQIEGEHGKVDVKNKFDDLPQTIQDHLFDNIPLLVIIYHTGDLKELVNIFITSNSMMAMTAHEKRILNYNKLNRWLIELCGYDSNMKFMFSTVSGMTSEYHIENKGDTLFMAEMLLWSNDNYYENEVNRLDEVYGPVKRQFKSNDPMYPSEKNKEITKKIARIMADGCASYGEKYLKRFSKSSLYNLFYTTAFLLQKGNIWGLQKGIDGSYRIELSGKYVEWFFNKEFERLKTKGTYIIFPGPNGKTKKQMHDYSFAKHNADVKHKSKVSLKDQGGSKYDFDDYARLRYLLEDLYTDIPLLIKKGIISKVGSRTGGDMSRDELMVAHNIQLSESDGLHLDEIDPVSRGGNRTLENTQFIDAKTNLTMSDRKKVKSN